MQEAILQAGVYFANTGSNGRRQKDYVLYVRLAYLDRRVKQGHAPVDVDRF